MPWRTLEDVTWADFALEVRAESFEALCEEAGRAVLSVMLADLSTLRETLTRDAPIDEGREDEFLHAVLERILYYKDSENWLMRPVGVRHRSAIFAGEPMNPSRHELVTDVKAITWHRFEVGRDAEGWRALVVVDV